MPNLKELKQRNRPESLPAEHTEQTVTLPYLPLVSAIPTDQWNMMLESQTAAIQRLQELAMHIATLPTVDGRRKQNDEELLPEHLLQADGLPVGYDSEGASTDDEDIDCEYGQDDGYDWMEVDEYTGALG